MSTRENDVTSDRSRGSYEMAKVIDKLCRAVDAGAPGRPSPSKVASCVKKHRRALLAMTLTGEVNWPLTHECLDRALAYRLGEQDPRTLPHADPTGEQATLNHFLRNLFDPRLAA